MDCDEAEAVEGLKNAGYAPHRSAFIQFTRLEYFSVMQQFQRPLWFDDYGNEIAFIEAVVRDWMRVNNINKVKRLYEDSRIGDNDMGYYRSEKHAMDLK